MNTQPKILIADDDQVTRELFKIILEREGYDVMLAEDGAAAVEMATSEIPDLVITDGLLPKLHGFLVCKAVKELNPVTKVILVTGIYTKPTYRWEAKRDYQADDLLIKPVTPADLLSCVAKHLAGLLPFDRSDLRQDPARRDHESDPSQATTWTSSEGDSSLPSKPGTPTSGMFELVS